MFLLAEGFNFFFKGDSLEGNFHGKIPERNPGFSGNLPGGKGLFWLTSLKGTRKFGLGEICVLGRTKGFPWVF